jgi:hypothetical protein
MASDDFIGVRIVRPIAIGDAQIIATNVVDEVLPPWTTSPFGLGDRVVVGKVIYESLQAANTNHPPATSPTWWEMVSTVNSRRMFDDSNSSQSSAVGGLSVQLRPGALVTSVALLNLTNAASVRVRQVDPTAGTVYDKTTYLTGRLLRSGWYYWLFSARIPEYDFLALDVPPYPGADVCIDIAPMGLAGGTVSVGGCVRGAQVVVGEGLKYGAEVGFNDYSRYAENSFGDLQLKQGAYGKRASFAFRVLNTQIDAVMAHFISLRGKPALFIGYGRYKCTVILGVARNPKILIPYPTTSDMSVDIRGNT